MVEWEYRWRQTYWAETGRSDGYVQSVRYQHVWKPDLENEEPFPDDEGLNLLGKQGFELVAMTASEVPYLTTLSPQRGDSYSAFTVYLLMFKRPLGEGIKPPRDGR